MSKTGNSLLSLTAVAGGAIGANRFVGFDDNQASVQGQKVKGVAEYSATAAGQPIAVTAKGTSIVEAGGAFAVGDPIISDNQGRAIVGAPLAVAAGETPVTSSAANGSILTGSGGADFLIGHALQAASAAGQFVEILLK